MYKTLLALFTVLLTFSIAAAAEQIDLPRVKAGDTWTYQRTIDVQRKTEWSQKHYESTVVRASAANILITTQEKGSKKPPFEMMVRSDWSRFRSLSGEEVVVEKPLNFPLYEGKTWELTFKQDRPNENYKYVQNTIKYTAMGWEDVEVPAGKFKALKIEGEGNWKGETAPTSGAVAGAKVTESGSAIVMQSQKNIPQMQTGRLYKAYWYVPSTKIYVKSIDESYTTSGMLHRRTTEELESYKIVP